MSADYTVISADGSANVVEPRIIRTLVFAPAHDRSTILRYADLGADAICLDMEDLTPLPHKDTARALFAEVAPELAERGLLVFARTNGLERGQAEQDLAAIVDPHLHCASLPKAEHGHQVEEYDALLSAAEAKAGVAAGSIRIRPVIETAMGVKNGFDIAAASRRVAYAGGVSGGVWGDLGASIGYSPMPEGKETFYLRAKLIVDVRAAGAPFPLSGGGMIRADVDGYRRFAVECKNLGYNGLHCAATPEIVIAVNAVFTPTAQQLADWAELVPQIEAAEKEGYVVAIVNGRQYDLAGLVRVREQLGLAKRLGLL